MRTVLVVAVLLAFLPSAAAFSATLPEDDPECHLGLAPYAAACRHADGCPYWWIAGRRVESLC